MKNEETEEKSDKPKRCHAEVFSLYENNGAGGMRPCTKHAEPGSNVCRYHRENAV